MHPSPKQLGVAIFLMVLIFPALGLSFTDRLIAVVNKEVITWSDLQEEVQDEYKRLKAKYRGEEFESRYHQKQREVLNDMIDTRLQLQEAKTKGLSITQEDMDRALRRIPLSATQTEEEYRQELLLKKLFDFEVRSNVVLEEEELRRYYEANSTKFSSSPQYRLKHILFSTQSDQEREAAQAKAQAIYEGGKTGSSFEDLAFQYSQQVTELGWVKEDELLEPIAQVIKDLEPEQISPPVESILGYHLLVVEEVRVSQPRPFESVEPDIRRVLFQERSNQLYREWLADLKQRAFIEVKF